MRERGAPASWERGPARGYRSLKAWQKAMELVVDCYAASNTLPRAETYGLAGQLRRAAVSVPANIAEGYARHSTREYVRHLSIAYASLAELETHLLIAMELDYLDASSAESILLKASEVGRVVNGLRNAMREKLRRDDRSRARPVTPGPDP